MFCAKSFSFGPPARLAPLHATVNELRSCVEKLRRDNDNHGSLNCGKKSPYPANANGTRTLRIRIVYTESRLNFAYAALKFPVLAACYLRHLQHNLRRSALSFLMVLFFFCRTPSLFIFQPLLLVRTLLFGSPNHTRCPHHNTYLALPN